MIALTRAVPYWKLPPVRRSRSFIVVILFFLILFLLTMIFTFYLTMLLWWLFSELTPAPFVDVFNHVDSIFPLMIVLMVFA